jgi:hypothetical protein
MIEGLPHEPSRAGTGFDDAADLVHDIAFVGFDVIGSDFTPDGEYRIFPPGRPNDTPPPTNTGMIRIENATRISVQVSGMRCAIPLS